MIEQRALRLLNVRVLSASGLDTCLSIMRVLHGGTGDPKYRPCPLLVQYVDAGGVPLGYSAGYPMTASRTSLFGTSTILLCA